MFQFKNLGTIINNNEIKSRNNLGNVCSPKEQSLGYLRVTIHTILCVKPVSFYNAE